MPKQIRTNMAAEVSQTFLTLRKDRITPIHSQVKLLFLFGFDSNNLTGT